MVVCYDRYTSAVIGYMKTNVLDSGVVELLLTSSLAVNQFHPKTGQFWHFFEVKNVVNFANSSRQYSVKAGKRPMWIKLVLYRKYMITDDNQNKNHTKINYGL